MTDYKHTLNLPNTAFPMKANLAVREPKILAHWEQLALYSSIRASRSGATRFIVHDGPPYANARPHLGTALNKILKDMVVKSKTLSGFDAPFVPGWDCHGLPIELNVEKKKGKPGHKLSPSEFRSACRAYADSQVQLQREDFQRLGVVADWHNPYLTMDFSYEANAVRALKSLVQKGHLKAGKKPVHWCLDCRSALAEAEVVYQQKTSPSVTVGFDLVDAAAVLSVLAPSLPQHRVCVPIWTTTPWTLPANQAVCLHPTLTYVLLAVHTNTTDAYYLVMAEARVSEVMAALDVAGEVVATFLGEQLEHARLAHPLAQRTVPIILGEHVTTEAGTGNVHTAPAHGVEDFNAGLSYDLSQETPVTARGCFAEDLEDSWANMHIFKADDCLLSALQEKGALLAQQTLSHSYPHCWRHKTPLIFRATAQWFVSMDAPDLRQKALAAIDQVHWHPAWGQSRIANMVASRPDWCVSRQRTWGIPLPLLVHADTGALHPETIAILEKVADQIEQHGVSAWFDSSIDDWLGEDAKQYLRVVDTLDVWFDSGISHYAVLAQRPELSEPADLYLEGSDQHRGWFQSSLLTSLALNDQAPYKSVLTHGYVVDGKGHKMSKSLGNTVLPSDVVNRLGADVLRLWVASSDHSGDIHVSDEILNRTADAYRRIRNTARFLLANLADFDPAVDIVSEGELLELDRWLVAQTGKLQAKIIKAYEDYQFTVIYQSIHNFCAVDLGGFYLDIVKDRQYTAKADSTARRSGQTAMYYLLEAFVRWIAPILSFTAEEIWQHMPGERAASVFLSEWYADLPAVDEAAFEYWQWFLALRTAVNRVLEDQRAQGVIRSALDAQVIIYASPDLLEKIARLGAELRFALITSQAGVRPLAEKSAAATQTEINGLWVDVLVLSDPKCSRCWQRQPEVGQNDTHEGICTRCVVNVAGQGEVRQYA